MNKEITLRLDERYAFDLETHGGGGYLWRVVDNDESVLHVEIKPWKASQDISAIPIGKSFPVQVEIKALAIGNATLLLEERRGWEKDSEPLNRCSVTVTINP